mmetsp:Transcript_10439/g.26129  ORF Transcript_10439/g.26129 Transcript_10439/m.26129 type:complete len:403 (-) Transcript_10439:658-1866(-)
MSGESKGVVKFSKDLLAAGSGDKAPLDYGEAKEVQAVSEDLEIVERATLSELAEVLSASEQALRSKVPKSGNLWQSLASKANAGGSHRRPASSSGTGAGAASVSGRAAVEQAQALQELVKRAVKLLEKSETTVASLREQVEELEQEKRERVAELDAKVEEASSRATVATERAEDAEFALDSSEKNLRALKRVNRVLILENALAVEQLKRHNVAGVEIPMLKVSDSFAAETPSPGESLKIKVTPLDPTSRQARMEASPIGKSKKKVPLSASLSGQSLDWDEGEEDEASLAASLGAPSAVTTPQSQQKLLQRTRRRMLLIDQTPSTPIAIDPHNTSEAVDALVDDLMTRLNMVDLDITYKKMADFQYKIGDKLFHLKNINGRLFALKGGGYQDLLMVLTSFLRL